MDDIGVSGGSVGKYRGILGFIRFGDVTPIME